MPTTLPKPNALSTLNTVQPRMAKVQVDSPTALIDVNQPEILDLIRQALVDCGLKHEAAAAIAGVKPSQFSAALNGEGNFGARWIWAQDDRFILRLLELVMEARNLTPENVRAIQRKRIVELVDLLLRECA